MKKIFIYYSLTGNGDIVAEFLKNKNVDIRKVKAIDKMPKNFLLRILTGGFLAGINYKAKLVNFDNNINDYDEIIIGSPIWNGKLSCPINSVIDKLDFNNKNITFILYSGSGTSPKATEKIKELYPTAKIINIKEPKTNKQVLAEIIKI